VRLQNLETRAPAATDLAAQLRTTAQSTAKSYSSSLSSSFGTTLNELEAAQGGGAGAVKGANLRQDLVAPASNSRTLGKGSSTLPASEPTLKASSLLASAPAAPAIVTTPTSTDSSTASGLQSLVDAADRTAATTATSTQLPAAVASTPKDDSTAPPDNSAAPPTLYSSTQGLSTDPTVFTTENYSEQLLYSSYLQQANNENSLRYQNYTNEYQNWQLNGSQGQPPDAPVYETIDQNAFGQWYAQMTQNYSLGENAPDVSSFMANGPDYGNGYYGAVGSSQVGTLYNPTGPATAAQISAANGSSNSSTGATRT